MIETPAANMETLYYLVGAVVVMGGGAIVTAIGMMMKASYKAGQDEAEKRQMKIDINKAHEKIREIQEGE